MKTTVVRSIFSLAFAIFIGLLTDSAVFAVADMSEWVAIDTTAGLNNYGLTSSTSAGGTFADRRLNAASLSDHVLDDTSSLVPGDGAFDWFDTVSMSGTVTFSSAFDPVMFIGWYNSSNLNERLGIGVANPIPAGTGIRWQTQSGNVGPAPSGPASSVNSQNFTGSTTTSTFAAGNTYSFTFNYDGDGHMTGTFGTLNFARNYAVPNNTLLSMDRFGLLQKATANDDTNSYTFTLSNVTYTGQTELAAGLSGDHNGDGNVDAADYVAWRKSDINGQLGYDQFFMNFGASAGGAGSAGGVPEPSSILLAVVSIFGIIACVRSRT